MAHPPVRAPHCALLLVLLLAPGAAAKLRFTYRMKGAGDSKGFRGAIGITINQSIRSLIRDGFDYSILPTVTYTIKATKAAAVGYRATLFGATGTFSNTADPHGFRVGEVAAGAAFPPQGLTGDVLAILPVCSPECINGWCYKQGACDCFPADTPLCYPNPNPPPPKPVCNPDCVNGVCDDMYVGANATKNYCRCDITSTGGYCGATCTQTCVCPSPCQNGGRCVSYTNVVGDQIVEEPTCLCVYPWYGPTCESQGRRRLEAASGDEARAVEVVAKALRKGHAAVRARSVPGVSASEAPEVVWKRLEALMNRLCGKDLGFAIIKETGTSAPVVAKLPSIFERFYCAW